MFFTFFSHQSTKLKHQKQFKNVRRLPCRPRQDPQWFQCLRQASLEAPQGRLRQDLPRQVQDRQRRLEQAQRRPKGQVRRRRQAHQDRPQEEGSPQQVAKVRQDQLQVRQEAPLQEARRRHRQEVEQELVYKHLL